MQGALAHLDSAVCGVDAANALVAQIETQMADATSTAPTLGRILYRLAQPGEVLTLLDLSQVYMEIFLPAHQAMRTGLGAEARIHLDSIPYALPAYT